MLFCVYTGSQKVLLKQNGLIFMQKRILFKSEVQRAEKPQDAPTGALYLAPVRPVKRIPAVMLSHRQRHVEQVTHHVVA